MLFLIKIKNTGNLIIKIHPDSSNQPAQLGNRKKAIIILTDHKVSFHYFLPNLTNPK